jgi:hypothetical protein
LSAFYQKGYQTERVLPLLHKNSFANHAAHADANVASAEAKGQHKYFLTIDPAVLDQQPACVRRQFKETFFITHRGGLERGMKFVVDRLAVEGFSFSKSAALLSECHSREFHVTKELYYLHREFRGKAEKAGIKGFFKKVDLSWVPVSCAAAESARGGDEGAGPSQRADGQEVPIFDISKSASFGDFRDPGCGYRTYLPTVPYFTAGFLSDFRAREKWLHRQLVYTDMEFLRCDHTFMVSGQIEHV